MVASLILAFPGQHLRWCEADHLKLQGRRRGEVMRRYLLFSLMASVFVTGATGQTHGAASARRGSNSQKGALPG
jgi:hypothetical protein